jgi:hypothetical protein
MRRRLLTGSEAMPPRQAVADVAGSAAVCGTGEGRLVIDHAAPLRTARAESSRIVFAKSRQFYRFLMVLWQVSSARADRRRLTGLRTRRWGQADRPPYGKIKAARCGPVGRLRSVGMPAPWRDVRSSSQPAFSEKARRINARHTSRAVASGLPAVRATRSVAPRVFRPFGSAFGSWHTVAMSCPREFRQFVARPGRKK